MNYLWDTVLMGGHSHNIVQWQQTVTFDFCVHVFAHSTAG